LEVSSAPESPLDLPDGTVFGLPLPRGGVGLEMNRPSADLAGGGPVRFFASASSTFFRGRPRLRRRDGDEFRIRFRGGSDFDLSFGGRPRPRFLTMAVEDALVAPFVSRGIFLLAVGGDFAVGVVLSRLLVDEDARGFNSLVSTPARSRSTNKRKDEPLEAQKNSKIATKSNGDKLTRRAQPLARWHFGERGI
jgi:hypothetical protein